MATMATTATMLSAVQPEAEAIDFYRLQNLWTGSGPTQPPIQCSLMALLSGVNRPGKKLDHLHQSGAILRNNWSQCALLACTGIRLPLLTYLLTYLLREAESFFRS